MYNTDKLYLFVIDFISKYIAEKKMNFLEICIYVYKII